MPDGPSSDNLKGQAGNLHDDHADGKGQPLDRSAQTAALRLQLRQSELAFIAKELALLGHENPQQLTA